MTVVTCSSCGSVAHDGDRFCEGCGHQLGPAVQAAVPAEPAAVAAAPSGATECGACGGAMSEDGWCLTCGAKAPDPRDHVTESPADWVAMTSDRGRRHTSNEDAGATAADPAPGTRAVLVVCDGVSTAPNSAAASLAAATSARDLLAGVRAQGLGTAQSRVAVLGGALTEAAALAQRAVAEQTPESAGHPPSCTFVAAVVDDGLLVTGSVGDSRAYWFPDGTAPELLTDDDSVAAELITQGIPREQAENAPQAHAITRWLGVDSPSHDPRPQVRELDGPGWLLVCSDGLWNYCSAAPDLAALVRRTAAECDEEPARTSAALVAWANAQGGRDNITVALARIPAATKPAHPVPAPGRI
jgi:serine/threonine protein phosphatase PrpC